MGDVFAQIRSGGAKLKPAGSRPRSRSMVERPPPPSAASGDIMSQLKGKLAGLRVAIEQGDDDDDEGDEFD